jgi:hypothetical protein
LLLGVVAVAARRNDMLDEVWRRYRQPVVIAETGHFGEDPHAQVRRSGGLRSCRRRPWHSHDRVLALSGARPTRLEKPLHWHRSGM